MIKEIWNDIKGLDHLIDAARYACMMRLSLKNSNRGKYSISIL